MIMPEVYYKLYTDVSLLDISLSAYLWCFTACNHKIGGVYHKTTGT